MIKYVPYFCLLFINVYDAVVHVHRTYFDGKYENKFKFAYRLDEMYRNSDMEYINILKANGVKRTKNSHLSAR